MSANVPVAVSVARWSCVIAAAIGAILTVTRSYGVAGFACCDWAFWYLVLRIAVDFVLVPGVCALLITSGSGIGRGLLWAACIYLAAFVYVPFFIPVSLLCLWAHFRWLSRQTETDNGLPAEEA